MVFSQVKPDINEVCMTITTAQIRAARGLLNWNQSELADRTGISATTIGTIEKGVTHPREDTIHAIQRVLEKSGVEFLGDYGVRLRALDIQTFTGQKGFHDFYDDVYETLKENPGEVVVSNVDERDFVKWLGAFKDTHIDRMKLLKDVTYRILIRNGDDFTPASAYAKYRWMPQDLFASVPFYVYGTKTAILLFGAEPRIICMMYPEISAAYRLQFDDIWNRSSPIHQRRAKA